MDLQTVVSSRLSLAALLLTAGLLSAAGGCSSDPNGGEDDRCESDADCPGNLRCEQGDCLGRDTGPDGGDGCEPGVEIAYRGECVPTCLGDDVCAEDTRCRPVDGAGVQACLPKGESVGEPCTGPGECVEEAACIGTGGGESYECMATCGETWSICENDAVCTPVASGDPVCYTGGNTARGEECGSNLDCETGLLCVGVVDRPHHCLEACRDGGDGCGEAHLCRQFGDAGKGYCRHTVGRSCVSSVDCRDELTCTSDLDSSVDAAFPSGYCTDDGCESDADCPGGAVCRTHPDTSVQLCFAPCEVDVDCRLDSAYGCLDRTTCENSADPEACKAFRDGADLCVPPGLQSW